MKKTEVKIDGIHDQKVKTKVLKEISKQSGVDNISVDKEKRIVTIIGDVDPVKLITKIRKIADCCVEVVAVGPPKKPVEKKADDKKPCWYCKQLTCGCPASLSLSLPPACIQPHSRCSCRQCQPYAVCLSDYDSPGPCTIV